MNELFTKLTKNSSVLIDFILLLLTRSAGIIIGFVSTIFISHVAGASTFGLYMLITSWIGLVSLVISLGLPNYWLREFANIPRANHNMIAFFSIKVVLILYVFLAAICLISGVFFIELKKVLPIVLIAIPIPMIQAATLIFQSAIRNMELSSSVSAFWPTMLVPHVVIAISISLLYVMSVNLGIVSLMAITLVAHTITFIVILYKARLKKFCKNKKIISSNFSLLPHVKSAFPFLLLAILATLNTRLDLLMLGGLASHKDVGIYSVATKISDLLLIPVVMVNSVIATKIAKYYIENDYFAIKEILIKASLIASVIVVPLGLGVVLFSTGLIQVLFGSEYSEAKVPTQILAVCQMFNAAAAGVGMALSMCRKERESVYAGTLSAIVNFTLNLILIPRYGATGAAVGTAISFLFWRLSFIFIVAKDISKYCSKKSQVINEKNCIVR